MASSPAAPVVDFGAHYYALMSDSTRERMRSIEEFAGAPICTEIDAVRERFAAAGIDASVLSTPGAMGSADADRAAAANDALHDVVVAHDEFYGLAAVPTAAGGDAAAAEFERCLDAGFHGGGVETKSDGIELVDDAFEPVFEVADRTGAPLLVHPKLRESLAPGALDGPWELNSTFGREIAIAESIWKVIHEGVYERYPDLALVFHHNGGNLAAFHSRIEMQLERAHRGGGSSLKTFDEFQRLLETRVYFDTSGYDGDPAALRSTLETMPAENLLFASDFPYETVHPETFRKMRDAIGDLRAGPERDAILGGNALDLLVNVDA